MQKKSKRIFQKKGFKNFKALYVLCFLGVVLVLSCKQETSGPTTEYISNINFETITLIDGSTIDIDMEDRTLVHIMLGLGKMEDNKSTN